MATVNAQIYKIKLQMIVERELLLSDSQLLNKEWFPNFIIVRRNAKPDQFTDNFEGFLKQINVNLYT